MSVSQKKSKSKASKAAGEPVAPHVRNEGDNTVDLAWKPTDKQVLVEDVIESEEFDYDSVKNDENIELWAVRIPTGLNPKYLDNLTLQLPSSSRSGKLGTLSKKGVTYDITSFPSSASLSQDLQTQAAAPFGAEELDSLSCLLPRKKKGAKLFVAPKKITRNIVISQSLTSVAPSPPPPTRTITNAEKFAQPPLNHRFVPLGADKAHRPKSGTQAPTSAQPQPIGIAMDVDESLGTQIAGTPQSMDSDVIEIDADAPAKKKKRKKDSEGGIEKSKRTKKEE